jgi:phosphoribosylanthranilate isomerase
MATQRTKIKICGLTREADVDACVAAGVDFVGFVLYPKSPRAVSLERALELAQRLPASITPILLLVNENAPEFVALNRDFLLGYCQKNLKNGTSQPILQFHGDETPDACAALAQAVNLQFWRAARIPPAGHETLGGASPSDWLVKYCSAYPAASAFLLDTFTQGYGGGGHPFDWHSISWSQLAPNVRSRLVLGGGLSCANVGDGMAQARPWAVDVSSGVELVVNGQAQKGIKDAQRITQFVAQVRQTDAELSAT